ncbi:MAG: universal stress protein [Chitinophagaceae bacterium]|nr:MAG: universal stress protein [Chitinophagaceae bacterium]
MKKFIAAFDGLNFCESTMSYSIYLAQHCGAKLVGVFLEDFSRRSYGTVEIAHYAGEDLDRHIKELDEKDDQIRRKHIRQFQEACKTAGIQHAIHRDRNVAMQELLHESIYADLLIISPSETLTRYQEPTPSRFVRELLNDVQCPVVLVPATYHPVNKIILLYDGEPSSVHAVRTFSYLFENMKDLDIEVLTIKEKEDSVLLPDGRLIKEFIQQHYPSAEAVVLKGDPEEEIALYLQREKRKPIVVCGSYQRSKFSRLFKPSMADYLLRHATVPLFVAHNKS